MSAEVWRTRRYRKQMNQYASAMRKARRLGGPVRCRGQVVVPPALMREPFSSTVYPPGMELTLTFRATQREELEEA